MENSEEKNWFQRNWLWAIPAGCFSIFACCSLFIFAIVAFFIISVQNSDIYAQSMTALQSNERAIALLGEPIEPGWLLSGNLESEFSNGSESSFANLDIPVSGPDGSGRLIIVATNRGSGWNYDQFELQMDDGGETVDLRDR